MVRARENRLVASAVCMLPASVGSIVFSRGRCACDAFLIVPGASSLVVIVTVIRLVVVHFGFALVWSRVDEESCGISHTRSSEVVGFKLISMLWMACKDGRKG